MWRKLVLNWKKRQQTRSDIRRAEGTALDKKLPDAYKPALFDEECSAIYDHIFISLFDSGESVYESRESEQTLAPMGLAALPATAVEIDDDLLARVTSAPVLSARVMETVFGLHETWATATEKLLSEETRHVEFKQSARWSLVGNENKKLSEQIIAKTVAGFLNGEGGKLFIGVNDVGKPVGLAKDFERVNPRDADGFVNWLDTMLRTALRHAGARRVRIRIDIVDALEVCQLDVPASSRPIWTKFKKDDVVIFEQLVPSAVTENLEVARPLCWEAGSRSVSSSPRLVSLPRKTKSGV